MGGGLMGSETSEVTLPDWLDQASQDLIRRAEQSAQIGHMANPNAGVAAFTPMQVSAMNMTNGAARAYGMPAVDDVMAGMPQAKNLGGGVMGYRSHPGFKKSQQDWRRNNQGQAAAYGQLFVDPKGKKGGGK